MNWQFTPYTFVLMSTAGISAVVAIIAWRRRMTPGALPIALLMLAVTEWTFTGALEFAAVGVPAKIFWSKVEYLGTVYAPILFLIFALEYTRQDKWLTHRNIELLCIVPTVTLLLAATNEWHNLIWDSFTPSPAGQNLLVYGHGAWFWVAIVYFYLAILVGTLALVRAVVLSPELYRGQAGTLLIAPMVPWIGNVIYVSGLSPLPGLELTPISFAVTGSLLALGIFQFRLFDLVPVARHRLIESLSDGVLVLDAQNRIVDINPAAQRIIGVSAASAIGKPTGMILAAWPDLVARYRDMLEAQAEVSLGGNPPRVLDLRISPLYDRYKHFYGRLIALRDITERKRAEEALRESEGKYRQLFDLESDAIFMIDNETGQIIEANAAASVLYGYSREELLLKKNTDLSAEPDRTRQATMEQALRIPVRWHRKKDGAVFPVEITASHFIWHGHPVHIAAIRDIAERKRAEEELRQVNERLRVQLTEIESLQVNLREQATRDPLTGLFNRRYLEETLERELARATREGHPVSLVMMDIDHFKGLNDAFGHKAGDLVLQALGKMLRAQTRHGDVACRYGGEEFVIVMPGAPLDAARQRAEQWRKSFNTSRVDYAGQELQATISVGVAAFPDHGTTSEEILRVVDDALYAAKSAGRNRVIVWNGDSE